jgi:hypothetical protein
MRLNAVKKPNFVGGLIIFSAAEFFRRTGRKVLLRVGNTIWNMVRIHEQIAATSDPGPGLPSLKKLIFSH